ncbi:MAG: hypothetical protein PHD13_02160 [Methanocellales archaeon]|nr:hypothetical protein [Methanocellales archaeon]MDD5234965.1 hypothetical protein [Methanocellales archaeon]
MLKAIVLKRALKIVAKPIKTKIKTKNILIKSRRKVQPFSTITASIIGIFAQFVTIQVIAPAAAAERTPERNTPNPIATAIAPKTITSNPASK